MFALSSPEQLETFHSSFDGPVTLDAVIDSIRVTS